MCKSTENQTCPLSWFLTPVMSDPFRREASKSCLSCLFMNQKPTLSCLVASGGGTVIGVWIWLLWLMHPSAVVWLPWFKEPQGTLHEATGVSRG